MSRLFKILGLLGVFAISSWAAGVDREVLEYVRVIRVQRGRASYSVDMTISADIPALSKQGVLKAIKKHSPRGFSYEDMFFRGDGMVKTNVIARYLQAELVTQRPEDKLAIEISPLNYRFTLKGHETINGHDALVYEVKPLRKNSGLFRGKVWLDHETLLPLREQGKLEKMPSIWVKEITFTRDYEFVHGFSFPRHITSEVNTRIVGKANINIDFTNYRVQDTLTLPAEASGDPSAPANSHPKN